MFLSKNSHSFKLCGNANLCLYKFYGIIHGHVLHMLVHVRSYMRTYFKSVIHGHVQSVYNFLSTINTAYGHTPAWKDIFCKFHNSYLC